MIWGAVVEGHAEELALPRILDLLGVPANRNLRTPRRAEGKSDLLRRRNMFIEQLVDKGVRRLVVVFDADGPDGPHEEESFRSGLRPEFAWVVCFIPVRMLEAWLLADGEAVKACAGLDEVPVVARPELEEQPSAILDGYFREGRRRGYDKVRDAVAIFSEARAEVIALKCPSFTRAKAALEAQGRLV